MGDDHLEAVVLRQGALNLETIVDPIPAKGQVMVRTLACGICGSDLHFVHHAHDLKKVYDRIGTATAIEPDREIVMGHEFCGELLESLPGYAGLTAGTSVCSLPFAVLGDTVQSIGFSAESPGGFGQYMALDVAGLIPVPNGLAASHAALAEPMAVGIHAVGRGRLQKGDVALVIGCGPVGLAVVAALRLEGKDATIVAADFNPARRAAAIAMGAHHSIDPAITSPFVAWADLASPPGYDSRSTDAFLGLGPSPRPTVVFECVGTPGILQKVFEGAMRGTRVVVVGVCMQPDLFEPLFPLNKECDVHFSFYYGREEFIRALHYIAQGEIDVAPLVSRTIGLADVPEAFRKLESRPDEIKVIVEPWQ